MQHNLRRGSAGFTLVEMMTVIVAASIVTLAATTLMLFGLRANNRTSDSIVQQHTSRTLMTTLEGMAMDTDIGKVENDYGTWTIFAKDKSTIRFSYSPSSQTIYAGSPEKGMPVLENVLESEVTLDEERRLLTFSVTTEDGTYSSSVYCRTALPESKDDDAVDGVVDNLQDENTSNDTIGTENSDARIDYLRILASQYKLGGKYANNGLILNGNKDSTGQYYSEWYIGGYTANSGWNAQTPWCACYLSWALNVCKSKINTDSIPREKWYASVDDFMAYFKSGTRNEDGTGHYWLDDDDYAKVRPGDLILFDWNLDNDPSHIGAVLMIQDGRVYTIEGNTSNRVGVRSYKLDDPRILGYGVIDWAGSAS